LSILAFQSLFLSVGFEWEDAILSASVVATSLNLSCSYYYTVYGQCSLKLPTNVVSPALENNAWAMTSAKIPSHQNPKALG